MSSSFASVTFNILATVWGTRAHHQGCVRIPAPPLNLWITLTTESHLCNLNILIYEMHTGTYMDDCEDSASLFVCYAQLDVAVWADIVVNHVILTLIQSPSSPHGRSLSPQLPSSLPWCQSHSLYHHTLCHDSHPTPPYVTISILSSFCHVTTPEEVAHHPSRTFFINIGGDGDYR